jgi:hypothetical protein
MSAIDLIPKMITTTIIENFDAINNFEACKIITQKSWENKYQPDKLTYAFEYYNKHDTMIFTLKLDVLQILLTEHLTNIYSRLNKLFNRPCTTFDITYRGDGYTFSFKLYERVNKITYIAVISHLMEFLEFELYEQPSQQQEQKHTPVEIASTSKFYKMFPDGSKTPLTRADLQEVIESLVYEVV